MMRWWTVAGLVAGMSAAGVLSGCKEVFSFPTFTQVDGGADATLTTEAGQDGASSACTALTLGPTKCERCIASSCCNEYRACERDNTCAALVGCLLEGTCMIDTPDAAPGLATLAACVMGCEACSTCTVDGAVVPCRAMSGTTSYGTTDGGARDAGADATGADADARSG